MERFTVKWQYFIALLIAGCFTMGSIQAQKRGQARIDSLLMELPNAKEDSGKYLIYFHLAKGYSSIDPTKGIKYATEGLEFTKKIKLKVGIADMYLLLGENHSRRGEHEKGLDYMKKAKDLFAAIDHKGYGVAKTLKSMGILYFNISNYPNALASYNECLNLFRAAGDKKNEASILENIGSVHRMRGNLTETIKYYMLALRSKEINGTPYQLAMSWANIGELYMEQQNWKEANYYHEKAFNAFLKENDKISASTTLSSIGYIYFKQKNYSRAKESYDRAIEITGKPNISVLSNYAELLLDQKQYKEALSKYEECIKMAKRSGSQLYLSILVGNTGTAYLNAAKEKEFDTEKQLGITRSEMLSKSIKLQEEAIAMNKELGALIALKESYWALSGAYELMGDHSKSLEYYKLYSNTSDSIFTKEESETVARLREEYESDKKNTAIDLLNKEKSIQAFRLKDQQLLLAQQTLLAKQKDNELQIEKQEKELQELENEKKQNLLDRQDLVISAQSKDVELLNKDKVLQDLKFEKQKANQRYLLGGLLALVCLGGLTTYHFIQRRKLAFSKKVSEVEMKALRAQMNPHFIFNSLNSINNYIQQNNFKAASSYLLNFSALTRMILENSQHQYISLADEIKALEIYISLENQRMTKQLSYDIRIDDHIDAENILIPPMILQPFIENSILHGLQHKNEGDARIEIVISREGEMLKCTIRDNGIGRDKSLEFKIGTYAAKKESLGMKLTEQRISIINKLKNSKAQFSIKDLIDDSKQPAGVQVELLLPMEQRF